MKRSITALAVVSFVWLTGCASTFSDRARYGLTVYCPGAGNVDFGDAGLREGLVGAGYQGEVQTWNWTFSFNPAVDQMVRFHARLRASMLANHIEKYIDQYVKNRKPGTPEPQVNLVGLSAGSGLALWALEDLRPGYQVDNVVLLGSSLSHTYDASKALARVRGKIYNYYSSNDAILAGPMKVFGTIDAKFGVEGAGEVGLHPPVKTDRVVNIGWRPEYSRFGYSGGHTDSTSPRFVKAVLSKHLIPGYGELNDTTPTMLAGQAPLAGSVQ